MRHTALKPLLGIAVVLGTIAGATNAAFASSSQSDFSRPSSEISSELSSIAENTPPQIQSDFQVAQFSLFPWNTDLRDRQNQASREVQRCLDKRSRRDRENCLANLRNNRRYDQQNHDRQNQDYDRQNQDRRNDRNVLSREEKRCLEKRSYRDRENCLTNLRNTRRYDRPKYDRRFPLSQPYPGTYRR